jgi:hypothetical protein
MKMHQNFCDGVSSFLVFKTERRDPKDSNQLKIITRNLSVPIINNMGELWHLLTIDQCINNVLTIESESESERKHSLKGDKCLGFQITNE